MRFEHRGLQSLTVPMPFQRLVFVWSSLYNQSLTLHETFQQLVLEDCAAIRDFGLVVKNRPLMFHTPYLVFLTNTNVGRETIGIGAVIGVTTRFQTRPASHLRLVGVLNTLWWHIDSVRV